MLFKEEDIQFERITPRKFEELCFDILLRMGYQSLIWRQGGADQGRDIEGKFIVNNQLVGTIEERWFFECKHYTNGVPVEQISTKIAWADAEGPNHFVLFTSSYLSNSSRQWLEKMQKGRPYKIHIIEGKIIKHLIVNTFPDLINEYFVDKYEKLLLESMRNWMIHDIVPNPPVIYMFEKLNFKNLGISEISFLWCAAKYSTDEIDDWCLQEDNKPFSVEFLFDYLYPESNCKEPIIRSENNIKVVKCSSRGAGNGDFIFNKCLSAEIIFEESHSLYTFVSNDEGKGIEVLISANSDFTTKIRYVEKDAIKEMQSANEITLQRDGLCK
ncbi:restriction endonuclease [Paenibacillus polymyxa]|uniref:restriction endonuclease n=1 Tax=Paenibacillus polymyxa TaxID=1406 RepID=UPI002ED19A22|nr:restriction endonuclease [Paenibacillus polymyxa]